MLPKVLVVTINAWRDNTGISAHIEFFKCWNPDRIAQIYTRSLFSKTKVCHKFFSISENVVMKSVIHRGITTGREVRNEAEDSPVNNPAAEVERKMYASPRGKFREILSICREIVWKLGKWRTSELDHFIDEFDPDVLFITIYPTIYMGKIQKYIIERTKKPVVACIMDDNYTFKSISKAPLSLLHRFFLRKYVRYIVNHSQSLMVIPLSKRKNTTRFLGWIASSLQRESTVIPSNLIASVNRLKWCTQEN